MYKIRRVGFHNHPILKNLQLNNIEVFLDRNSNYFESFAHRQFILEQCKYMGEIFSLDALISMITTPSQFYPF